MAVKSLGSEGPLKGRKITSVRMLGAKDKIVWKQSADALTITPPAQKTGEFAYVFRIDLQ